MDIDGQAVALVVVKSVLAASALVAIGLGLTAAMGVTRGEAAKRNVRQAFVAAAIALACGVLRIPLVSASLAGDIARAFDPSSLTWAWTIHQSNIAALVAGAILLATAAAAGSRIYAALGAGAIAAAFAFIGHTQALAAPGFAPAVAALHVLLVGFWITAPYVLWPTRVTPDTELIVRLDQFSRIAVVAVPALFGTGVWLAWRLLGDFGSLFAHPYGQLLTAKAVFASAALGLGVINKQVVVARARPRLAAAHARSGCRRLRRSDHRRHSSDNDDGPRGMTTERTASCLDCRDDHMAFDFPT